MKKILKYISRHSDAGATVWMRVRASFESQSLLLALAGLILEEGDLLGRKKHLLLV